ncbi:hypothetical protein FIM08_02385 [SAR202 cluster bacterium AC-647-N09_OGT_505m]|nr:hypothetical protein [SAR202 cluster bacterium AC-647-N09_OGT_505m]
MDLYFERGTTEAPRGHALVYFRQKYDPDVVLATYIITLPVKVDVSKYIPPMFAAQMQGVTSQELSGFAFPPLPEKVESLAHLQNLAETRDDDLIDGGTGDPNDPMELLQVVNELQQEYTRLWEQALETHVLPELSTVNEFIYELMGELDKLSELSKLVGKLRFATDGSDSRLIKETEDEISTLARFLPEHYRIPNLVQATEMTAVSADMLAQLYLERCYKLHEEDYRRLQEVEQEIQRLEEGLES